MIGNVSSFNKTQESFGCKRVHHQLRKINFHLMHSQRAAAYCSEQMLVVKCDLCKEDLLMKTPHRLSRCAAGGFNCVINNNSADQTLNKADTKIVAGRTFSHLVEHHHPSIKVPHCLTLSHPSFVNLSTVIHLRSLRSYTSIVRKCWLCSCSVLE